MVEAQITNKSTHSSTAELIRKILVLYTRTSNFHEKSLFDVIYCYPFKPLKPHVIYIALFAFMFLLLMSFLKYYVVVFVENGKTLYALTRIVHCMAGRLFILTPILLTFTCLLIFLPKSVVFFTAFFAYILLKCFNVLFLLDYNFYLLFRYEFTLQ